MPAIGATGRYVAFVSDTTNLVPGDTNGFSDVFVRDSGAGAPWSYCVPGPSFAGCSATIACNADPDLAHAQPCIVTVTSVEGGRTGILFYGLAPSLVPWCASAVGSMLCVGAPIQRTGTQVSGGTPGACDGAFALDWNAFQLAHPFALGQPWSVGSRAYVQAWFRDPPSCATTSLSDAVELTYRP
jgi:hypothetical protein